MVQPARGFAPPPRPPFLSQDGPPPPSQAPPATFPSATNYRPDAFPGPAVLPPFQSGPSFQPAANEGVSAKEDPSSPEASAPRSSNIVERALVDAAHANHGLPTIAQIEGATEPELRAIAKDLLASAVQSRISAAIAEVRNEMAAVNSTKGESDRRDTENYKLEVDNTNKGQMSSPGQSAQQAGFEDGQASVDLQKAYSGALKCQEELAGHSSLLEKRLRTARRQVLMYQEKLAVLEEENSNLKRRIVENREHYNRYILGEGHTSPPTATQQQFSYSQHSHGYASQTSNTDGEGLEIILAAANASEAGSQPVAQPVPSSSQQFSRSQQSAYHPFHTPGQPLTPPESSAVPNFMTPACRPGNEAYSPSLRATQSQEYLQSINAVNHDSDITVSDLSEGTPLETGTEPSTILRYSPSVEHTPKPKKRSSAGSRTKASALHQPTLLEYAQIRKTNGHHKKSKNNSHKSKNASPKRRR